MNKRRAAAAQEISSGGAVVVYRSGVLYEADVVAEALERAKIPHFRREESSSGLTFATPAAPSMGPGDTWAILVPEGWAGRAKKFIAKLPVPQDPEPGVWGFRPRPEVKQFFKQWAWVYIVGLLLVFLWNLIQLFRD